MKLSAIALMLCACSAFAADADVPAAANDEIAFRSLWINAGMLSHHFDRSKGFREGNIGFGAEVDLTEDWAVYGGGFRNSDDRHSNYVGAAWRPLKWGPMRFGLVGGGFNGYQRVNHGGWFPGVLPVATLEYGSVGVNMFILPTISDKVYGATVFQFKLRLK